MKRIFTLSLMVMMFFSLKANLILTGVLDGPLPNGTPKVLEFYVINDIPDLSIYGFGVANNGGGTDGQEYAFPADAAMAGDFIYVTNAETEFITYLGFNPDYVDSAAGGFNGDDGIEVYQSGAVIDVFGDINLDGTAASWEYLDSWAYRVDFTGPDGSNWTESNWTIQDPNILDNTATNADAMPPFPYGTYQYGAPANPTVSFLGSSATVAEAAGSTTVEIAISGADMNPTSVDVMVDAASTAAPGDYSISATSVTFPGSSTMNQVITVTINDDIVIEPNETIILNLMNPDNSAVIGTNGTYTLTIQDDDTPIPALVINEFMYNNPGTDSLEFIEIYNNDSAPIDLAGFSLTNAVNHTWAVATVLNPGDYYVICGDAVAFNNAFGFSPDQWTSGQGLNNTGETIELRDPFGNMVDVVTYDNGATFPSTSNSGPSVELCDFNEDNNDPFFWFSSTNPTGIISSGEEIMASPGMANVVSCASTANPIISVIGTSVSVTEDIGSFSFDVAVAFGNANPTNVDIILASGSTATDGADFTYSPTTLTFPAGVANDTMTVTVNIIDDADQEIIEEAIFALANADNGATVSTDSLYTVSILDNDTPPAELVITEIMYNNTGTDSLEFIEIFNNDVVAVDLNGYSLSSALAHTWTVSTILNPGDYYVIALDAAAFNNAFGFTPDEWDFGGLNNTGETIELIDASGNVVDFVTYDDGATFPSTSDSGPSLELCDVNEDNNDPFFWFSSTNPTGVISSGVEVLASPGMANVVSCTSTDNPVVSVIGTDVTVGEDAGSVSFDVAIAFGNANPTTVEVVVDPSSTATDGADFTYAPTSVTFPGGVAEDTMTVTVTIIDDADEELIENAVFALANVDNGGLISSDSVYTVTINDNDTPAKDIVINEIFYNSPDGPDEYEFLELYNNDTEAVDLEGYTLSGVFHTFVGSTVLNPGEYLVLSRDAALFDATFGTTSVQWDAGGLNNGGETVSLFSNAGVLVDSVTYSDLAPWPLEADGQGYSLVLCDPSSDNGDAGSWDFEKTDSGVTIDDGNGVLISVFATPGAANDCLGVYNEEIFPGEVKLFPNPVSFELNIRSTVAVERFELYNTLGQLILSGTPNRESFELNVESIPSGTYFIRLEAEGSFMTQSLVVE